MSYCVHCGVELADCEPKCPLCGTEVLDPKAPNRKGHIPYVFKALITDDPRKIGECIVCQDGKS